MKARWLDKKLTREDIEAMTGKKVIGDIITGELDTDDPEVKEKGIEIEFEGDVAGGSLKTLNEHLDKQGFKKV